MYSGSIMLFWILCGRIYDQIGQQVLFRVGGRRGVFCSPRMDALFRYMGQDSACFQKIFYGGSTCGNHTVCDRGRMHYKQVS